ncbi:helix-turn-helix domain-containing protein [Flagellimonas sp.]|uniref:helix-turn-helix domain-containing protein n=1 Tax=Flagellimonas sp. TaxID=2058762 RepID=UPI003BAF748E
MLGERLKRLRLQRGYTLVRLEEVSGVSYVQIGRYEKDKVIPNSATLKKLADALEVSIESILEDSSSIETVKDEDLNERFEKFKEVVGENDSNRRTLLEIIDLMMFQGSVNGMLTKKSS